LLLKAALIQVSDYRLLGASGSSDNQNNHGSDTHFTYTINYMVVSLFSS
jgi:hypothetical protein